MVKGRELGKVTDNYLAFLALACSLVTKAGR